MKMDLFVVNRYEGEETKQPEQPHDHLSDLLRKIEERKRQKQLGETDTLKPPTDEPPGKKKKRKKSTQNSQSSQDALEASQKDFADVSPLEAHQEPDDPSDILETTPKTTDNIQNRGQKDADPTKRSDFMILGSTGRKKKQAVKRVLPRWLANPEIISADLSSGPDVSDFSAKLDARLISKLRSNGVERLFPVQSSLITWLSSCAEERKCGWWPRDTCVSAPTGSGKTLAYVLPILEALKNRLVPRIRCLVVLPVQELAAQVFRVFQTYAAALELRVGLVSGAVSFEAEQTSLAKRTARGEFVSRVDIVVATSGRLIDHVEKTEGFSLDFLEFLVIDEADRAVDWLRKIPLPHRAPPPLTVRNFRRLNVPPAQKLLFSATLSQDPEKLSRLGLFQPILFTSVVAAGDEDVDLDRGEFVGRYTSPSELIERAVECPPEYKPVALVKLITSQVPIEKTLVFTNSGEASHRLAVLIRLMLDGSWVVEELSAQLVPKQRAEVLKRFADGECQVLVSSDALARGLDIAGVKLVVSYDLPKHIKGYIHRSGRTGRAGLSGTAISILTSNQVAAFRRMLTAAHKAPPTIEQIESIETVATTMNYQQHVEKLRESIQEEKIRESVRCRAKRKASKN